LICVNDTDDEEEEEEVVEFDGLRDELGISGAAGVDDDDVVDDDDDVERGVACALGGKQRGISNNDMGARGASLLRVSASNRESNCSK
jgi:hypothetical protein